MTTDFPGWMRTCIRATIRAGAPVALAAGVLTAPVGTAAAAADADIRVLGGNASSAIVCGNVAAAETLARQRHIVLQRSHCTARASGGDVTMSNVDIYVSPAALARNRGNALLAAFAPDRRSVDAAACADYQPPPTGSTQLNRCWAIARGGRLHLRNVTNIDRRADGTVTTRTIDRMVLSNSDGTASAACANIVNDPLSQRDDCNGVGQGADWSIRGVDAVVRAPDGSTTTRRGINVEVRGGRANASIHCFNVTDGSGHVIQINVCNADAQGGDATLRDVTIHTG